MNPKNTAIIAWKQTLRCHNCKQAFPWKDTKSVQTIEHRDPDGIKPEAPACPNCLTIIPAGRFIVPEHHHKTVFVAAAAAHSPPTSKGAPCFVRGLRGGAILALSFPYVMTDKRCGDVIDESLVRAGFPEKCGTTWLRTAVWKECEAREGQGHEMVLVHFDGRYFARTPATEWFTVVPEGFPEET